MPTSTQPIGREFDNLRGVGCPFRDGVDDVKGEALNRGQAHPDFKRTKMIKELK